MSNLVAKIMSNDVCIQVSILLGKLLEYWKYWAGSFKVRGQSDGHVPLLPLGYGITHQILLP